MMLMLPGAVLGDVKGDGINNGINIGAVDGVNNGAAGGGGGGLVGKVLLVDAASFLLQTDGASKVCLAGGC